MRIPPSNSEISPTSPSDSGMYGIREDRISLTTAIAGLNRDTKSTMFEIAFNLIFKFSKIIFDRTNYYL